MSRILREMRIEGNITYVPLTRGYEAIIDTASVPLVEGFNWQSAIRSSTVYAVRKEGPRSNNRMILMHRHLLKPDDCFHVDHINGVGLDNRMGNLRLASHGQNMRNSKTPKNNTSGFKGVSWCKIMNKWGARIMMDGRNHILGYHDCPKDAHAAYVSASKSLHGEFGRSE